MGVLTTRGHALETLSSVTDMVFDKTGTLTRGKLFVTEVKVFGNVSQAQVHALAAGLEKYSEHPIAVAISEGIEKAADVEAIESLPGMGVLGRHEGQLLRLGNLSYVRQWHVEFEDVATTDTCIYLATQDSMLARFELGDEIRSEAKSVVQALKKLGVQLHIISGDNEAAVTKVAIQLGIKTAFSQQLPDNKLAYVKDLQQQGRVVAMVGDGVNDAPVLAGADVSIAMGGGAQLAQASADMVLLSENLNRLPQSIERARETLKIVRQNFIWAIGYNLLALPLAAAGYIAPWMAAIGMSFSSLFVVLNALRLRESRRIKD
jgi:Cu2+-exporting ATPase